MNLQLGHAQGSMTILYLSRAKIATASSSVPSLNRLVSLSRHSSTLKATGHGKCAEKKAVAAARPSYPKRRDSGKYECFSCGMHRAQL
jgi:hypothetical protein